jgi:hypothetical protein
VLELRVLNGDQEVVLKFEHSLLSLSKWESRTKRPFYTRDQKTPTELLEYFRDMLVSPEDDPDLVYLLDPKQMDELGTYINAQLTASSVPREDPKYNGEQTTSELIYYWLSQLKIPFHPTETWHLSRTLMLVQIASFKQQPPKKRPVTDTLAKWAKMNDERRQRFNTSG